ncbi:MAG: transglutaminase-like domain-containing protein [Tenacibaculum sp.]
MDKYLKSTVYLNYKIKAIQELIAPYNNNELTNKEKAIALYLKIRDAWWYDPYTISLSENSYKASVIAKKNTGNCVEKSVLLVACLRGVGIMARLHLGKVKNHIAVERLTEKFGTNELTPHGMVSVFLGGKWLKLSPAFNKDLCQKFKIPPLNFDGENSSYLQQYNSEGSLFMEYLEDYGYFDDVPLTFMKQNVIEHYPHIFNTYKGISEFRL